MPPTLSTPVSVSNSTSAARYEFIEAGLEFARETYDADSVELRVATFDERAISAYECLGFERVETYWQETNGVHSEVLRMQRD